MTRQSQREAVLNALKGDPKTTSKKRDKMKNKQGQAETQSPMPSPVVSAKSMEVARSGPMDLRAMRQVASAMWVTIQQFIAEKCIGSKTMATAQDTASEYNWILGEIDTFYAKARHGIGDVKVYLVAESLGFTKQMEVSIKEKDANSEGLCLAQPPAEKKA